MPLSSNGSVLRGLGFAACVASGALACDDGVRVGACEYNYREFYGCYDEPAEACEATRETFGSAHFVEGVACDELGYTIGTDPAFASEDETAFGRRGVWGDNSAGRDDDGGGGGGGEVTCGDVGALQACTSVWACEDGSHGKFYCINACGAKAACDDVVRRQTCDIMMQFGDIDVPRCCPDVCD